MTFDHFDADVQCDEFVDTRLDYVDHEDGDEDTAALERGASDHMDWLCRMADESDRIADDLNHQHFNGED